MQKVLSQAPGDAEPGTDFQALAPPVICTTLYITSDLEL